jgi:hypothetical protein
VVVLSERAMISSGVNAAVTAGLVEEIAKFGIVALIWAAGCKISRSKPASVLGIREPLEGIYVGIAAGAVFAFIEALLYVPKEGTGAVLTRTLAISPGLHAACAGLMGYFFGLALLMPKHRWKMLAAGYAMAAGIHACWDLLYFAGAGILNVPFALLNYGLLGSAILKSRKISPTRRINFATETLEPPTPVLSRPAVSTFARLVGPGFQPAAGLRPAPPVVAEVSPANPPSPTLRLPGRNILLLPGIELLSTEIPGLTASGPEGAVASVERHDRESQVLGLCNRSTQSWMVTSQKGTRSLAPGQAIKVRNGVVVDFGGVRGEFTVPA